MSPIRAHRSSSEGDWRLEQALLVPSTQIVGPRLAYDNASVASAGSLVLPFQRTSAFTVPRHQPARRGTRDVAVAVAID